MTSICLGNGDPAGKFDALDLAAKAYSRTDAIVELGYWGDDFVDGACTGETMPHSEGNVTTRVDSPGRFR